MSDTQLTSRSKSRGKVLLVDDDPDLLRLMCMRVQGAGFTPVAANNAREALAAVAAQAPLTVVTDLRMEGMDGLGLYEAIHRDNPLLPVIIITAHGTIPDAVDATRRGVFAFLTKPFDGRELIEHIERALALVRPDDQTEARAEWAQEIVTQSPRMLALLDHVARIAETDVSVLIRGPSGSGKAQIAQAIHRASPRSSGPFIAVSCGSVAEHILESALFGPGSGTGAAPDADRTDRLHAANGGTLFLDEIGDMPIALQSKLQRALADRQFRPVGDTKAVPLNIRVVSATHHDLEIAIAEHRFREDLYYQLNVAALVLPALEERREDIPALVRHRLSQLREQTGSAAEAFTPAAMELLMGSSWPGNVRQLFNVVEHCHALATAARIPADLTASVLAVRDKPPALDSLDEARALFDHEYLVKLMKMTAGNVARAAQLSGRNRTDLYKLLRRYGIEATSFKPD